jgi:hypothetical protein
MLSDNLTRNNNTRSCGCLQRERTSEANTTHGMTDCPEYITWLSIRYRCTNPNSEDYPSYSERGVCQGWHDSFESFYADMGDKPTPKHTIDRWPNQNGGYWCGHCEECLANGWKRNARWATTKEQNRNKRNNRLLELDGRVQCVADWADELHIDADLIHSRLRRGASIRQALNSIY